MSPSNTQEQDVARALDRLTGAGYQRSLHAAQVLLALDETVDLGDLRAVVERSSGGRVIGVPVPTTDLHRLAEIVASNEVGATGLLADHPPAHARLVVPLAGDARHELVIGGRLHPAGAWTFATVDLRPAIERALTRRRRSNPPTLVLRVVPAAG
jgi:hypothetical protein